MLARDTGKDALLQGADYRTLRGYNHLLVLNSVRLQGPAARVTLAQLTGLSKTTVSSIIDQLLQDNLVTEGDFIDAPATGGRRPILVQFNEDIGLVLGIEVRYSTLTLVTTNLAGQVKSVWNEPFDFTTPPQTCLAMLSAAIRIFMARADLQWDQILGIGIGMARPIDTRTRTMLYPPGAHAWDGIDIVAFFEQQFQVPVYVDNNANLAAFAEGRYGAGKSFNDFVYIIIGQGIGCGVIRNQQIYHGAMGAAGEIGHLHLADDGPVCICGKRGCLETLADNGAIIDDASQGRSLARVAPRARVSPQLANADDLDINDILHAAESGEMSARLALQQAGRYIGAAVAIVINLLNPEVIILEGATVRTGRYLLEAVQEESARHSLPAVWPATAIIPGQLGDISVALGAATVVIDAAFALSPATTLAEYPPPVNNSAP
jgi:glucokinase-like ROK family protein